MVRCVSPIGTIRMDAWSAQRIATFSHERLSRVAFLVNERMKTYDVTVEGDVLPGDWDSWAGRVGLLILSVTHAADRVEKELLKIDQSVEIFADDLEEEVNVER